MAAPSYTYTLTNATTADASQVMQNFNDVLNGITDGTKDLSISALTCAGTATLNGHINLGNSSADDLTITASLASTLAIKTTNSYDIGSSTKGLAGIYFGANSQTVRVIGSGSMSATWTLTLPVSAGTNNYILTTNGSGVSAWTAWTNSAWYADGSNAGTLSATTQTIGGAKTFNALITASSSTGGVAIESARSSPAVSDTQNIYSFTFTPTLSNPTGVAVTPITSSASTASVIRVGSYAIVSMRIRPTTTGAGLFGFRIANPFSGASNAGATSDASGAFNATDGTRTQPLIVSAVSGQTYFTVQGICTAAITTDDFWGTFMMKVQ